MGRRKRRTLKELDALFEKRDPADHAALCEAYWKKVPYVTRPRSNSDWSTSSSTSESVSETTTVSAPRREVKGTIGATGGDGGSGQIPGPLNKDNKKNNSLSKVAQRDIIDNNEASTGNEPTCVRPHVTSTSSSVNRILSKEESDAIKRNLSSKKSRARSKTQEKDREGLETKSDATRRVASNATPNVAARVTPKKMTPRERATLKLKSRKPPGASPTLSPKPGLLTEEEAKSWADQRPDFDPMKYLFGDKSVDEMQEQNNTNQVELSYDEKNPFTVCAESFVPLYRGTPTAKCGYCGASYAVQYKGNVCSVCQIGEIGLDVPGLQVTGHD